MKNSASLISTWAQQVLVLEKMNHLQQTILQTSNETNSPGEALALAYQMLTNKQKIAFILAGGASSLFHYQQHPQTGSDTDQLPVCFNRKHSF
ncbi:MAG TPA: hypothetical protein VGL94_03720 [Ktedonobacteraceae bacterium]|jgi:hypothetical protein